jgi:ligand-binding SRPBCC domain-containing protein
MPFFRFRLASVLAAPCREVWAHASSLSGVNRELFPLARMTYPAAVSKLGPENVVPGKRLFRSWILLFGLLPIDYDDITLVELEPGKYFQEESAMLTQRVWRHRRSLQQAGSGCLVTDEIEFVPRLPLLGPVFHVVFRMAFRLRHRNLRRRFGGVPA